MLQNGQTHDHTTPASPEILYFAASEKAIYRGLDCRLSWKVAGARRVVLEPGFGKVESAGAVQISPTSDTIYTLSAYGAGVKSTATVRLTVFPLPQISSIAIPMPTQIRLETDIHLITQNIPAPLQLEVLRNDLLQRIPKIELAKAEIQTRTPDIRTLATALGREAHELTVPVFQTKAAGGSIRSALLNGLEKIFKNNWRAMQVISQIRKTYER
jgi:hypothetical protein